MEMQFTFRSSKSTLSNCGFNRQQHAPWQSATLLLPAAAASSSPELDPAEDVLEERPREEAPGTTDADERENFTAADTGTQSSQAT